jgi:addiction module RelE/StbE family toxin
MKVLFSTAARADIAAIHDYIAARNPQAARSATAQIEKSTDRLSQFPHSGRLGAIAGTRELVVRRLPYIVVYRVTEEAVEIVAVFHAAQDIPRG